LRAFAAAVVSFKGYKNTIHAFISDLFNDANAPGGYAKGGSAGADHGVNVFKPLFINLLPQGKDGHTGGIDPEANGGDAADALV